MCGIAGIVNRRENEKVDGVLLRQMTDAMHYRGPDAEGFFVNHHVGFGHRRLRIIDLEGGKQPLYNEDNTVVVTYNGEIYNFAELQKDLEARGHTFRTRCDTEVIVHAYEEYGEDCPKLFRGMFAFAVYDMKKDVVFIARDRMGIKPLYYWQDADRFLFASEVKPLLKALGRRPSVNVDMLDFYVTVGYVPGEETLFAGIKKLLPGHSLTLKGGAAVIRKYWDLEDVPPLRISFDEAKSRFEALLLDCVRMRLVSEVPLGAFLSGGLDSSSVVAFMSRLMSEPVKTFSVGYEDDPRASELEYARQVAGLFKTDHHEFILRPKDFLESLDLLLEHSEEPVVESAAVALYQLSKLAREHVTVILSGEGGDEALAGYPLHQIMPWMDRVHSAARWLPSPVARLLGAAAGTEKQSKYWDWAREPLARRYRSISHDVTDSIKRSMYADGFRERVLSRTDGYFQGLFEMMPRSSRLRRMSYVDIKSWLPDDLLLKADKMTMATSLELRVPFLDYKLIEFCTALPDRYRLRGGEGKHLLKKTMEPYLPREIIYRQKKGFPVPIAAWFRGDLYGRAREMLLDRRSLARGYFKESYIAGVLERHREGREDLSRRIFSLLALETWHRKYID